MKQMKEVIGAEKGHGSLTVQLAHNFYTARDPAGVMCFYDAREVCWFGISAREEAFSFRSLQAAMASLLSNMPEYDLAEEQYQVLYSGEDSCLVAGSFELHDSGRIAELKRMSCFWTLKEREWRLNRLRLSLPRGIRIRDGSQRMSWSSRGERTRCWWI